MSDKKTVESLSAIKQYISKSEQNADRHKANILIHANKNDYGPRTLVVYAAVKENFGQMIIEDLNSIYSSCSNTFTTKDSCFSFVSGTLRIYAEDAVFGEMIINVT